MARTATITLDDKQYVIHALNMKELEEVAEIIGNGNANQFGVGRKILAVAMRRAEPKPEDFDTIEPLAEELSAATSALLQLSGLNINPQTAAPTVS